MSVSLAKGGNVSLSKAAPGLTKVMVGLGWDARETDGVQFDLDASALACGENKKVLSEDHFVFYGSRTRTPPDAENPKGRPVSPDGSIMCGPDNLTGEGEGDDEFIDVDLESVSTDVTSIVIVVSIDEAEARSQNFGQVSNAYIRVVDSTNATELARYDLAEDASTETAMVFGELYRREGEWKFRAIGSGYASGLAGIVRSFGVDVA